MNNKLSDAERASLVSAGHRTIGFEFDGSGDQGDISMIVWDKNNPHKALFDYPTGSLSSHFMYPLQLDAGVRDKLNRLAWDILDNFPGDWYNNDGGYGIAVVDLVTGTYRIEGYERYMEVHYVTAEGSQLSSNTASLGVVDLIKATLS